MQRLLILGLIAWVGVSASIAQELVDKNTLALWTFDEGNGDVLKDTSGNKNDGDIEDGEWVEGIFGQALAFDGKSSRVVISDSETLHPNTGDITIEAWAHAESDPKQWGPGASGAGAIVFKQDAYQWAIHGELDGTLWFGIWGARIESTGAYLFSEHVGEWHHTALTFEGKSQEAKIYVDGELKSEGIVAEAVDPSPQPLYIGFKADDGVYFHGRIDVVRISDVVRTEAEINEMIKHSLAVGSRGKLAVTWAALKANSREQ